MDITRIISDEKIALVIAEEMTRNSALEDYINRYAASDVVGDIELYTAKLKLEDLKDWGGKLYNGKGPMPKIDMTNKDGSYDGIWDSRFGKAVKAFLEASSGTPNLKEVYDSLKTLDDKKMFLIHWINLDW